MITGVIAVGTIARVIAERLERSPAA